MGFEVVFTSIATPFAAKSRFASVEELRGEYARSDFTTLVRGKYAARLVIGSNIVVLEPEVAKAFPNDKAVNDALRGMLEVAATTARLTKGSTRRPKKRRTR